MKKNVSPGWNILRAHLPNLDGLDNKMWGFWASDTYMRFTWDFGLDLILRCVQIIWDFRMGQMYSVCDMVVNNAEAENRLFVGGWIMSSKDV